MIPIPGIRRIRQSLLQKNLKTNKQGIFGKIPLKDLAAFSIQIWWNTMHHKG
jgi:hypothetical protein